MQRLPKTEERGAGKMERKLPSYKPREIKKKRRAIENRFARGNFSAEELTPRSLQELFYLYDEIFLEQFFLRDFRGRIDFSLSRRMTRTAGKVLFPRGGNPLCGHYEIRLSLSLLKNMEAMGKPVIINGLEAQKCLAACQLVLEHEICHVLEFCIWKETSCRRERFRKISRGLFGHRGQKHNLPPPGAVTGQRTGLKPGDTVGFSFRGVEYIGFIYRLGRGATVMVSDPQGDYRDRKGRRYRKFYLPAERLEKK